MMFQNFEVLSSPDQAAGRIARLREGFAATAVNAIAVPRSDEYLGEYVPACAERLAWLTGYTGSAGSVLVLEDKAHIFVDGRYTNQVRAQTDPAVFDYQDSVATPLPAFLEASGLAGLRLGIDPWTWPSSEVARLETALKAIDGQLVFLPRNPVDAIWDDRPQPPLGTVTIQPLDLAGQLARDKLAMIAETAARAGAGAVVLADPSSVAWSFNIRGEDLPSTPHPLSRAIIPASGRPLLFIDKRKTGIEAEAYLTQLADLEPPSGFDDALVALGKTGASIMVDPAVAPHAISMLIEQSGGSVRTAPDPARLPRACKNRRRLPAAPACTGRTAPRWCGSWPGSTARSPARSTRSPPPAASRNFAARPASPCRCRSGRCPSTRSPAPAPTPPSSTTASTPGPTAGSNPARCCSSIPADNMLPAPLTSPAPSPWAMFRMNRNGSSRSCSRA